MSSAVERLVNFTLFLASSPGPVTAVRIRDNVAGYSADSDEAAFKRMLERDKEVLRSAGLVILSDDEGNYRLDRAATYVSSLELTAEEAAAVRAAGVALLGDPAFPFREDLRLALTKLSSEIDGPMPTAASLADEEPEAQGNLVADLSAAASRCKRVRFGYTNSAGVSAGHEIEPYGLFLHDGRWYLVGRDVAKDEVRTYAATRITDAEVNGAAPKTPDFTRPRDFDVASFIRLPFQYGRPSEEFVARIHFAPDIAWRAQALSSGHGTLQKDPSGVTWTVAARSRDRLLRFLIESGPGLEILEPSELLDVLAKGLGEVEASHG